MGAGSNWDQKSLVAAGRGLVGGFLDLFFLFLGAVASFLDRGDQLIGFHFALMDRDNGFVGQRNFRLFDSGNFGKCRLHFADTSDGSGHSRDDEIDFPFRNRRRG